MTASEWSYIRSLVKADIDRLVAKVNDPATHRDDMAHTTVHVVLGLLDSVNAELRAAKESEDK